MIDKLTLRQWRVLRGLSQNDMAQKLGVHPTTYRSMENNPMNVRLINLLEMCGVLDIDLSDIKLSGVDMKTEEKGD